MRAWCLLPLAVTVCSVLAPCAAAQGAESAAGYRDAANAACQDDRAALVQLAALTRRRHLDAAEVIPRVEAINARFGNTIADLTPPPSLAGADRHWRKDIAAERADTTRPVTSGSPASRRLLATERAQARLVRADEQALGLRLCVRLAREPAPPIDA